MEIERIWWCGYARIEVAQHRPNTPSCGPDQLCGRSDRCGWTWLVPAPAPPQRPLPTNPQVSEFHELTRSSPVETEPAAPDPKPPVTRGPIPGPPPPPLLPPDAGLTCSWPDCTFTAPNRQGLSAHMRGHTRKLVECPNGCGRQLWSNGGVARHLTIGCDGTPAEPSPGHKPPPPPERLKQLHPPPTGVEVLKPGQVAAMFGTTIKSVARWATDGRLRFETTDGGHRRYPADQFDGYQPPDPEPKAEPEPEPAEPAAVDTVAPASPKPERRSRRRVDEATRVAKARARERADQRQADEAPRPAFPTLGPLEKRTFDPDAARERALDYL